MVKEKKHWNSYIYALLGVLAGIGFDQFTKLLVLKHLKNQEAIPVIKDVFELQYLENRGAAFGMMQGKKIFFVVGALIVLAATIYFYRKAPFTKRFLLFRISLILLLSGALGNMIDRLRLGYVVDFFYFKLIDFPIFNVADICVVLAAAGLLILFLFFYKEEDLELLLGGKKKTSTKQEY